MAPKTSGEEMAVSAVGRMSHDVGSDFNVPLAMFSGRNEDWPTWSARFGAHTELAGWSTVLGVAEAQTAPMSMVGAPPEAIRVGKIVKAVLLTKTEGTAFALCISHPAERELGHLERGLEPW